MKRNFKLILVGLFVVVNAFTFSEVLESNVNKKLVKTIFDTEQIIKVEEPFIYYKFIKDEKITGYAAFTDDMNVTQKGYKANVPIMLYLDNNGTVKDIEFINYRDTESIFKRIERSSFLKKLKIYKPGDKLPADGA